MKTLIKEITSVTSEGVSFMLTEPASLGKMPTTQWYVSWDTIGKALFADQYSDETGVAELRIERGETK